MNILQSSDFGSFTVYDSKNTFSGRGKATFLRLLNRGDELFLKLQEIFRRIHASHGEGGMGYDEREWE